MDETFELLYTWGVVNSDEGTPTSWFIKVQALDTDMYAVAHYDLEDTNRRFYECTNEELLIDLIGNQHVYEKCQAEKESYIQYLKELEIVTPEDFK